MNLEEMKHMSTHVGSMKNNMKILRTMKKYKWTSEICVYYDMGNFAEMRKVPMKFADV